MVAGYAVPVPSPGVFENVFLRRGAGSLEFLRELVDFLLLGPGETGHVRPPDQEAATYVSDEGGALLVRSEGKSISSPT